jgi:hypothetical protein
LKELAAGDQRERLGPWLGSKDRDRLVTLDDGRPQGRAIARL